MYKDGYELMAWAMFEALREAGLITVRPSGRYLELQTAYRTKSSASPAADIR